MGRAYREASGRGVSPLGAVGAADAARVAAGGEPEHPTRTTTAMINHLSCEHGDWLFGPAQAWLDRHSALPLEAEIFDPPEQLPISGRRRCTSCERRPAGVALVDRPDRVTGGSGGGTGATIKPLPGAKDSGGQVMGKRVTSNPIRGGWRFRRASPLHVMIDLPFRCSNRRPAHSCVPTERGKIISGSTAGKLTAARPARTPAIEHVPKGAEDHPEGHIVVPAAPFVEGGPGRFFRHRDLRGDILRNTEFPAA